MKRIGLFLGMCLGLLLPGAALADEFVLFSGLATSGTFGCNSPELPFAPCELNGFNKVSFQVTSTAGSVATVELKQRNTAGDPWVTVVQVVNPTATELGYEGVGVGQVECVVTWTSGTLRGTLVRAK